LENKSKSKKTKSSIKTSDKLTKSNKLATKTELKILPAKGETKENILKSNTSREIQVNEKAKIKPDTLIKVDELNKILVDILGNQKTIEHFKQSQEFRSLIARLIVIYNKYTENVQHDFESKYKKIYAEFDIAHVNNIPVVDIDIIDEINYLDLYFKNVFNHSVYDLSKINSSSFNATQVISTDEINTSASSPTISNSENQEPISSATDMFNDFERKRRILSSLNQEQLKKYWRYDPNFFPYDSKPKSIYISRIIITVLLSLVFALYVIDFTTLVVAYANKLQLFDLKNDKTVYFDFYSIIYSLFVFFIMYRLLYPFIIGWNYDKNKYYLKFPPLTVLSLVIYFISIFFTPKQILVTNLPRSKTLDLNPDFHAVLWIQWYSIIINMALVAFISIFYVVMAYQFNPKLDRDRINKAEEDFFKEVSKQ
jgi:hypothetical protein